MVVSEWLSNPAVSSIPLVDLHAQYAAIRDDVSAAMDRVLQRQVFISGPETHEFESEYAAFCGLPHAVAVASGTSALELAFEAVGLGEGDEVVTVSHTFFATAGAIIRTGASPVFVDIREDDWTMSASLVADAVTSRTKAIVPVHIYGHPVDVPAIAAAAPGIPIIEDAAQAHAAAYGGNPVGAGSAAACFSFYPGKNLGAYGDAGAVVTNDEVLAARIRSLRDHGRAGEKYAHRTLGTNARIAEFQAAVLRAKLPYLKEWTRARQQWAELYEERLRTLGITFQKVQPWAEHARHLFVLLHPHRDEVLAQLHDDGIGAGIHYPVPVHRQDALRGTRWGAHGELDVTDFVADRCLSLPLYPELGRAGVDEVLSSLEGALDAVEAPLGVAEP
jgi:dTDP-4-amino-4,6-dideoxygalactose transaminase